MCKANTWLVFRLCPIVCCFAVLMTPGCDGMVAVHGVTVKATRGEKAGVSLKKAEVDRPKEGVIRNAWVELWTLDGQTLLDRWEPGVPNGGTFDVNHIGLYERGMQYRIKAGAPGYQTISVEVKLRKGGKNYALIELAPVE